MKRIGVVSQKGGVGKSTLARDIARQFASDDWAVKIADLDVKQTTSCDWNAIRQSNNITPDISVESFKSAAQVERITGYNLVVIDGKGHSDVDTLQIAKISDLVVIPTGATRDDLVPQVRLAHELVKGGVKASRLFFVINNVIDAKGPDVVEAMAYIREAGYEVATTAVARRRAYQNAQDNGRSLSETTFPSLASAASTVVEEIAARFLKMDAH